MVALVGGRGNRRGVQTDGRQSSSSNRRATVEVGEACSVVSWAGGGWAVAGDVKPLARLLPCSFAMGQKARVGQTT
jgi:hypothetical protein